MASQEPASSALLGFCKSEGKRSFNSCPVKIDEGELGPPDDLPRVTQPVTGQAGIRIPSAEPLASGHWAAACQFSHTPVSQKAFGLQDGRSITRRFQGLPWWTSS